MDLYGSPLIWNYGVCTGINQRDTQLHAKSEQMVGVKAEDVSSNPYGNTFHEAD